MNLPHVNDLLFTAVERLNIQLAVPFENIQGVVAPYRICPLGAHIDHQGGPVLGRPIHTGTALAFTPLRTTEIRLYSEQFPDPVWFQIGEKPRVDHWSRYAQAAGLALSSVHELRCGFIGWVNGSLIGAGLSSSASVGLALLFALMKVNEIQLSLEEIVWLNHRIENRYLGLQNGILDPATITHGIANALLEIDTLTSTVNYIDDSPNCAEAAWLIIYSGQSRQLTHSGYNNRVEECKQAAHWLDAKASILSEVTISQYRNKKDRMPKDLELRASHYFSEVQRVKQGIDAWRDGNFYLFGELMNASCASSLHQYQSGNPQLAKLQQIALETANVFGSRFSGGGYGGCLLVLVRPYHLEEISDEILWKYRRAYPQLADDAFAFQATYAPGLRFVDLGSV
jgi:galactokinase